MGKRKTKFTKEERQNRKVGRVTTESSKFGKLTKAQENSLDRIKKELQDENVLNTLGGGETGYTYIHSNKYYAQIGLENAQRIAEQALLTTVVPQVKTKIKEIVDDLNKREKNFYDTLSDKDSGFVFKFENMKKLYNKIAGKNPNPENEIEEILNLLYALKEGSGQFMTFTKEQRAGDEGTELKKKIDKIQDDFVKKLEVYTNTKENTDKIKETLLKTLEEEELIKMSKDGVILSKKANSIWIGMGNGFEGIASDFGERVVDCIVNDDKFLQKVTATVTWTAKEKGIKQAEKFKDANANIGASDIVITSRGVDAGISLKFRQAVVREADENGKISYKSKFSFGADSTGKTLYDYNDKVLNGVGRLSKEKISILQYGIYNSKAFLNLKGIEKFKRTIRQIVAWQHIIQALIGVAQSTSKGKSYSDSYTVFLGIGDQLYRTADVLGLIAGKGFNAEDIEKMVSKGEFGNWERKYPLVSGGKATSDQEEQKKDFKSGLTLLEKTKKMIAAQAHKDKLSPIYTVLYQNDDVKSQIEKFFPKKDNAKFSVKYRISSENILKGVL